MDHVVTTKRLSARGGGTRESGGSQRRAELLAIAAELFATRGFLATTVREIADEAGILSGSLYHHFDSKESMADEILRGFLEPQRRAYQQVLREATDPRTALAELVRQSFRALQDNHAAIAIFQNESKYLAQYERFGYLRKAANEFERTWTRVLQDGQREGVFRADLDVKLTYRFIRDMVWTSVHWYNPKGKLAAETIAEQYIRILCEGIVQPE
ncbi:TetR family transcriptional regulator [Saccharopolyspora sp. HNM0983]|uniref:TetR family transcriptional regulator n=1 Tax=Saccharopolyspora montiporae TaxID=2781240 RepID=A0A929B919_9PSEU|nr:TetR family transcriptional regulator [Saccharopolyspora sp. HNM0983]